MLYLNVAISREWLLSDDNTHQRIQELNQEGKSQRQIAGILDTSQSTVSRALKNLSNDSGDSSESAINAQSALPSDAERRIYFVFLFLAS